jgi:beta-glucosidase/6-phospho-beta-glucosidase/beta-galactosidase
VIRTVPGGANIGDVNATGPWWGTAAAATQCEGSAPRSDWAAWEAEGRVPPSGDGNGFRTRYADDFALLAEHAITHHRLTIEWARLEPSEGRWDEDEEAHVRRVLAAGRGAGVAMWACLLHGSAPGWFTDDRRGWLDDKAATLTWPRHVDRVAEALGDLVAGWLPIHEPDLQAQLGYGEGVFPPGRHSDDDERDAVAALRTAEAGAARLLRSGGAPVAVAARPDEPDPDGDADDGAEDLLVVSAPVDRLELALEQVADAARDREILVVTGDPLTGADGLPRAVDTVAAAHGDGIPVVGAFHLPAIDGYEWHRGFDARLGLFDRDRNPRPALEALIPPR